MNRHNIAALLLAGFALTAQAEEPPNPAAGPTVDQTVARQQRAQVPFGSELANRVTTDVADRVDRALQSRLARDSDDTVIDHSRDAPQLVSTHLPPQATRTAR